MTSNIQNHLPVIENGPSLTAGNANAWPLDEVAEVGRRGVLRSSLLPELPLDDECMLRAVVGVSRNGVSSGVANGCSPLLAASSASELVLDSLMERMRSDLESQTINTGAGKSD